MIHGLYPTGLSHIPGISPLLLPYTSVSPGLSPWIIRYKGIGSGMGLHLSLFQVVRRYLQPICSPQMNLSSTN